MNSPTSTALQPGDIVDTFPGLRLVKQAPRSLTNEVPERRHPKAYRTLKRVCDVVGAGVLLLAASPAMVIVALLVKLTSPGPIILRQARLTEGGRVFTLLKFRTMKRNAEQLSGPVFAEARDPRITPIGRFLRKTRLDELPQLLNVLCGDMSLIGPRPERPEIAEMLKESISRFDKRLGVKAGLTGLAQVIQGYPDGIEGYREKLAWDVVYIQKQCLTLDLWIAFKTVRVILTGSGAR